MRLNNLLKLRTIAILLLLATLISLCYVYQQVKLLEISYDIFKTEKRCASLIDQNQQLRYNVCVLTSPAELEKKLALSSNNFVLIGRKQILWFSPTSTSRLAARKNYKFDNIIKQITSVITVNTTAEAKPMTHSTK